MAIDKCPYCSGTLKHGYITTKGEIIAWSPHDEKSFFASRWHVDKDDIPLGQYHYWKGCQVEAFYCDKCKKIIIDVDSNNK